MVQESFLLNKWGGGMNSLLLKRRAWLELASHGKENPELEG